jgi:hypothetical protein
MYDGTVYLRNCYQ